MSRKGWRLSVYELALGVASRSGIAWQQHWERWSLEPYTLEALLSRVGILRFKLPYTERPRYM